MKFKRIYIVLTIIGLIVTATGLWFVKAYQEGTMIGAYLCIGFGCGAFGHGFGELLSRLAGNSNPEVTRMQEIEKNDERNVALRNKAQAKAFNIMLPVFGALFVSFGLMNVDLSVILLLIAAYLFVCGSSIYYRIKYEKEM